MKDTKKVTDIVESLPQGLIAWYDFKKNSRALFITGGLPVFKALFFMLEEKGLKAEQIDISQVESVPTDSPKYDYIILAGVLERTLEPQKLLNNLAQHLVDDGTMIIAAFNRFNLGQFVGDKDINTGHVLDGVDNYRQISERRMKVIGGHSYSKLELEEMINSAGLKHQQFYSVFPSLQRPQIMLAYGEQINEQFSGRIVGNYNSAETALIYKETLYDDFMKNGLLHHMAEGYLIECSKNTQPKKAQEITVQTGRKPDGALATIVYTDCVIKKPMYSSGKQALTKLIESVDYLSQHNVPILKGELTEEGYVTPYIHGQLQTEYLRQLAFSDKEAFLQKLTEIKTIIENSSRQLTPDEVDWTKFDPYWESRKEDDPDLYKWRDLAYGTPEDRASIGVVLERGYPDLASINCFETENGPLYFDQEFYVPQLSTNSIFMRTLEFVYSNCPQMYQVIKYDDLLDYFNLSRHKAFFQAQANKYIADFVNKKELASFEKMNQPDYHNLATNRFRMDYTQEEYEKLFTDIFKDAEGKKMYLFGSGDYAKKFIDKYKDQYDIAGIIDNNRDKWGTDLEGIRIYQPAQLLKEESGYKVFICIKFYDEVLAQLKKMGVSHIGIYDPRLTYPRPMKHIDTATKDAPPKKYHVGYVAGVFDMFHIGHLNLLRRAKEQCDYLIVGIVTDEQILKNKKTRPMIPFAQRFAIVQACRYVDEAVTIPINNASTEYAYKTYNFDAQFSGSDYENDPYWIATRDYLRQRGSDLVFFPYTEEISSTHLKHQLRTAAEDKASEDKSKTKN